MIAPRLLFLFETFYVPALYVATLAVLSLHFVMPPSCDSWRQPNRPKKGGGKDSVALSKNATQLDCVVQDVEPPKLKAIFRKGTDSCYPSAVCNSRSVCHATLKFGKEKVHRWVSS